MLAIKGGEAVERASLGGGEQRQRRIVGRVILGLDRRGTQGLQTLAESVNRDLDDVV